MRWCLYIFFILSLVSCSTPDEDRVETPKAPKTLFKLVPSEESGVTFINKAEEDEFNNYFTNQYIYNGGGVGVGDINNDGLPDLYFTGNSVEDKLYLNKGNLKFEDITLQAGINSDNDLWSTGVSMIDINADGWLDIYVCKSGYGTELEEAENKFYLNKGDGTFVEAGRKLGLNDPAFSTQCSFFDYDRDGDLDLYVMNYPGDWVDNNKQYVYLQENEGKIPFRVTDHLYRNDGNAKFSEVSKESGINNLGFGLGLMTADFNDDGWIDIYVANDYVEPDYLYINQMDGTFKESIKEFCNHLSQSSMGMDYADFNNDGFNDIFVAEMLPDNFKRSKVNMASMNTEAFNHFVNQGKHHQYMHNVFQINTGNKFYSDISQLTGTDKTDWSWSPLIADFDQDGDKDLFVSNGIKRDMMDKDANLKRKKLKEQGEKAPLEELYNMIPSTKLKNRFFRNEGDYNFVDHSDDSGAGVHSFSNGAIYADLDNDGDLDIITNNIDEKAFIYQNESNSENFISIRLANSSSANVQGVNAQVFVYQNGLMQKQDMIPVRGFQSCTEAELHFALPKTGMVDSVIVVWDNDNIQWEYNIQPKDYHLIEYRSGQKAIREKPESWFTNITETSGVNFVHRENDFNDFEKEILLPHRQSRLGPFISVGDVNGDQLDDFYVGGAKGQCGELYLQKPGDQFIKTPINRGSMNQEKEEMSSCFFDLEGDGDLDLYVVSGGNENSDERLLIDDLYINDGKGNFTFSQNQLKTTASGSCVKACDFDQDGDMDLFVGGRAIPGKYPMADKSQLLINENGTLINKTQELAPELEYIGIVTDAVWTDTNDDGRKDLILCGEWIAPTVYENTGGSLKKGSLGINEADWVGWYYSVDLVDYNKDGKTDILFGNIGENHKFHPTVENPFKIYYDDFDQSGTNDIVLAQHDDAEGAYFPVRGKQCLSEQMPYISQEKFHSYEEFADANVQVIFGEDLNDPLAYYEARNFSSIVLLKSDQVYTAERLPVELQFGAINAFVVHNFDGDEEMEILFGGNMFETEIETSRADASVGGILDDKRVILNSDFFIPGDVKDIQLIRTGSSPIIVVAHNNSGLQIFKSFD